MLVESTKGITIIRKKKKKKEHFYKQKGGPPQYVGIRAFWSSECWLW